MFKRITSITIENFRAYYGTFPDIELKEGQNLLIYGENGSGKSSLYKGLSNYIASSNNNVSFIKNNHGITEAGRLSINFSDFDPTSLAMLPGAAERYTFSDTTKNNNVTFIQLASLSKGFLDYTDLLKVYLHDEPDPNLFNLVVLSLLANHVPISSGGTEQFGPRWSQLQKNLTTNSYHRNDGNHKRAIRDLPVFETNLRSSLDEVFAKLNSLLTNYFPDLGLQLDYHLLPLAFHYGSAKWKWYTETDLRLIVSKDGVRIYGDYSDVLNEAKLSAIAVCLYLSSLLINPINIDLKILYLDDVFVGLDAGNRLPILSIIRNEFQSYQKFISTYDRHWFELAKRQFELNEKNKWSTLEIYVGKTTLNGNTITKPILVTGQSNYERAVRYLHDRTRPDYPAAANYFRKAIEEDISPLIPTYEKVDTEFTQIPDYQLTSLLKRLKNFLARTKNSGTNIDNILGFLHTLLHPLSHHEISSPIYKGELEILERSIADLRDELVILDTSNNFKVILEASKTLRMCFFTSASPLHVFYYELILKDCLIVKKNGVLKPTLVMSACNITKMSEYENNKNIKTIPIPKSNPKFHYSSLKDMYDGSIAFLKLKQLMVDPPNFIDNIEFHNGTTWQKLDTIIVW